MCRYVREGFRKYALAAAALTFALASAAPSNAGTLQVDFGLSGSTLALGTLLNVANSTNGMGSTVTGMARVVLTGVNAAGMVTGASGANGVLSGLNLTFNVNQVLSANGIVLNGANLVGPISITQMGMANGAFDGTTLSLAQNTFSTQLAVSLDCLPNGAGSVCAAIAPIAAMMGITFPITQMATISNNTGAFPVTLAGLGNQGSAMLTAVVAQMNMGQQVTLTFKGNEVARNFMANPVVTPTPPPNPQVPEPVEAGLLILGVLGLCGVSALRRQGVA